MEYFKLASIIPTVWNGDLQVHFTIRIIIFFLHLILSSIQGRKTTRYWYSWIDLLYVVIYVCMGEWFILLGVCVLSDYFINCSLHVSVVKKKRRVCVAYFLALRLIFLKCTSFSFVVSTWVFVCVEMLRRLD